MDSLRILELCLPLAFCHLPQLWQAAWQFWLPISVPLGALRSPQRDGAATADGDGKDPVKRMITAGKEDDSIRRALARLRPFILPHWLSLALALLFMLGDAGMDLLKPWPLKLTFDVVLRQKTLEGNTLYLLIGVAALVVLTHLFEGLFNYLAAFFLNRAGRTIIFDIRAAFFDHIQRVSLQFHNRKSTGDLITRFVSDIKAFRNALTDSLPEVLTSTFFLIGMGAVLLWLDWRLTLAIIGSAPILLYAFLKYGVEIKERARAERKREGALASVVHEALGTTRLTRVFNREAEVRQRFQAESIASLQSGLEAILAGERFSWAVSVLEGVITAVVLGYGTLRVMEGAITLGTLVVFLNYTRNFYKPLKTAVKHTSRITRATAQMERVTELLDLKEGVTDLPGARPAPRLQGRIEFRNVSFAYEPGRPVFKEVSLTLPAGQVTAIVGPTGAGKTTLISLLPRLYDPSEGAVLIDGHDIREYTLQSLRSQISVVLQESVLLQASIAENITYGRSSASFQDIVAAAQAANAHDFIRALPQGYDTEVGERGEPLSGGQRQRITIARAMVRTAPILILDEPLAGLDAASAATVMAALERLMRGKTVILITHELSIAQRADQVVVLADGQLVQQGDHQELVEEEGMYGQLFQAQFAQ